MLLETYAFMRASIERRQLVTQRDSVLVAVSGGVDSVVLLRLLHTMGCRLAVAHVNYGLRGKESDEDEAFVQQLAEGLHLRVHLKKATAAPPTSVQAWARNERYAWFETLAQRYGYTKIAVAHHADDQIETILLRFLKRGSGVDAMTGMKDQRGRIIRPLLGMAKQQLRACAQAHGWNYREDSSNATAHYDRNLIRNHILPSLRAHFPSCEKVIQHNAEQWEETAKWQAQALEKKCKKHIVQRGNEWYFPIRFLKKSHLPKTILWHYASRYGFTSAQLVYILSLFDAENGQVVFSETHRFIKYQSWLILAPKRATTDTTFIQIEGEGTYEFPLGKLTILRRTTPLAFPRDTPQVAYLAPPSGDTFFPLVLRKKEAGDYFYPLGMTKKKKLSRFLIDQKKTTTQKENVWVLCQEKKLCWVVGERLDHRYRVKADTEVVYQVVLSPK